MMITRQPASASKTSVARRSSPNRTTINFWFDIALAILTIGTIVSAYLDKSIHILFGTTLLAAILVHMVLHWRWITATTQRLRQVPASIRHKLLLVLLLLFSFVPLSLSGAIVALIYAPNVAGFHTYAFYAFIALVLLHLVLSRPWIAARLKRKR